MPVQKNDLHSLKIKLYFLIKTMNTETKQCTQCKEMINIQCFFYNHKRQQYFTKCKQCIYKIRKERRKLLKLEKEKKRKEELANMTHKTCTECKIIKELKDFGFRTKRGYHNSKCRDCVNAKDRIRLRNKTKQRRIEKYGNQFGPFYVDENHKKCSLCKQVLKIVDFPTRKCGNRIVYIARCSECIRKSDRIRGKVDRRKDPEKYKERGRKCYHKYKNDLDKLVATRIYNSQTYDRKKKYKTDITKKYILDLYAKYKNCYWCKNEINMKHTLNRISIDRIDNRQGHTKDNIVLSCHFCNKARNFSNKKDYEIFLKVLFEMVSINQKNHKPTKYWESRMASTLKKDDKKIKRTNNIGTKTIKDIYKKQNGICAISGLPMFSSTVAWFPFQPSLDRIDNSKGHTLDNVHLVCRAINTGRGKTEINEFKVWFKEFVENGKKKNTEKLKLQKDRIVKRMPDKYKINDKTRICSKCQKIQLNDNFSFSNRKNKYYPQCKKCINKQKNKRYKYNKEKNNNVYRSAIARSSKYAKLKYKKRSHIEKILISNRSKDKKYDIKCNLKEKDVLKLLQKQNNKCYWCHQPLTQKETYSFNKISLDRKCNDIPHITGNILVTCQHCNFSRNCSSMEHFQLFLDCLFEKQFTITTQYERTWFKNVYNSCINSDKQCKRENNITKEFILKLFEKQNGVCAISGLPMIPSTVAWFPFQPSLDRIDNSKGHLIDNVHLVCRAINTGRGKTEINEFKVWFKEFVENGKKK